MVTEGSGDIVCVGLTATSGSPTFLANPLTVDLTTNLINAEAGSGFNIGKSLIIDHCFHTVAEDFMLSGTSITIPAGPIPNGRSDCVTVTTVDDDILERSEGFDVEISGTDLAQVSVGASDTTTVTINDNDGMCQSYIYSASYMTMQPVKFNLVYLHS